VILREKDKKTIIEIKNQIFDNSIELIAYGSRVTEEAHDMSDLDLVLKSKKAQKVEIEKFMLFKEKLQDSNIPILIQVIDWYRVPKSFHQNIIHNHKIIA
jgi:predicted nucleotidyltransferase